MEFPVLSGIPQSYHFHLRYCHFIRGGKTCPVIISYIKGYHRRQEPFQGKEERGVYRPLIKIFKAPLSNEGPQGRGLAGRLAGMSKV